LNLCHQVLHSMTMTDEPCLVGKSSSNLSGFKK